MKLPDPGKRHDLCWLPPWPPRSRSAPKSSFTLHTAPGLDCRGGCLSSALNPFGVGSPGCSRPHPLQRGRFSDRQGARFSLSERVAENGVSKNQNSRSSRGGQSFKQASWRTIARAVKELSGAYRHDEKLAVAGILVRESGLPLSASRAEKKDRGPVLEEEKWELVRYLFG